MAIPARTPGGGAYGAAIRALLSGGNAMSTTETAAQAGWYAVGGGRERYWDGWAWTERVRPVPAYIGVDRRGRLLRELSDFRTPMEFSSN